MSYQRDREEFISRITKEGLPLHTARLLLREATGLNRRAELACSSEAADRDRVPCPASKTHDPNDCLCDVAPSRESKDYPAEHEKITRITLQDHRAKERVQKALDEVNRSLAEVVHAEGHAQRWLMITQGDPRGYVLRVIPPSYAERNAGRDRFNVDAIGVPNGPSGLRF